MAKHHELTASCGGNGGLLSTKEAMQAWGVSRNAIRQLVEDGTLRPIIIGSRNWKFAPEDIEEVVKLNRCF